MTLLTLSPWVSQQLFTPAGAPAVGYKVFTYLTGSTTKWPTYSDSTGLVANTNPIIVDAGGRLPPMFFLPTVYKIVFALPTDTDPPAAPIWTIDGVSATPLTTPQLDITGTVGESVMAGQAVYLSDGSGGKIAGEYYLADADFTYASSAATVVGFAVNNIASGDSGTLRLIGQVTGLAGLVAGSLYYISTTAGAITTVPPPNSRLIAQADSSTSVIISQFFTPSAFGAASFSGAVTMASSLSVGLGPAGVGGVIFKDAATHIGTGVAETDASVYTLPAATLGTDGSSLIFRSWYKTAAGASTRTIKHYWNGATIFTQTTVNASGLIYIETHITRTAAATQSALTFSWTINGGLNTSVPVNASNTNLTLWDAGAPVNATLSGTVAMKTTVQDSAAGANITQLFCEIIRTGS